MAKIGGVFERFEHLLFQSADEFFIVTNRVNGWISIREQIGTTAVNGAARFLPFRSDRGRIGFFPALAFGMDGKRNMNFDEHAKTFEVTGFDHLRVAQEHRDAEAILSSLVPK